MILFLFIEKIIAIIQLYNIKSTVFCLFLNQKKAILPRKDKITFWVFFFILFVLQNIDV